MANSIWGTLEVNAWSRNFDYEDYLSLHSQIGLESIAVNEQTYRLLCEAFENQFSEDHDKQLGEILVLDN